MPARGLVSTVSCVLLSLVLVQAGHAQERPDAPTDTSGAVADTSGVPADTARARTDTARAVQAPLRDTTAAPDSLRETRSGRGRSADQRRSSRDTSRSGSSPSPASANAVIFSAQDSLVIRSDSTGSDRGTLYGSSEVSYQDANLEARTIGLDFQSGTLTAQGAPSDTAENGRPVFRRGGGQGGREQDREGSDGESFTGNVLSYNLNTERGRVVAARTARKDAFIEGEAVKMFEDSTLFVRDGTYTTCDCPPGVTPSYSLRSDEMKVQGKWVYTGPVQLFLFNVPTPLWLPFGFLPNVEGRRSGPLSPEYGEDRRGFFLKNWGWYFALNPYTDLTLQASVWSKGSFEVRPRFRYRKRYKYDGDLRLTYRRVQIGEEEDPNPVRRHEGQLEWEHSQDLSPTARLSGNVNLATSSDFARNNSDSYDEAVRQDISSNVRYRKSWPGGGRQFNISARQQQQLQSGEVSMTLPNLGFSQNSFKPFKQEQRVGDERWYEKIRTSYQFDLTNSYDFRPRDPERLRERGDSTLADAVERADVDWYEALFDRDKYELATGDDQLYDFQASHRIPLNMSFRVDRYNLSLSPNLSYTSDWYISTIRRVAQRDSSGGVGEIVEKRKPGFYARRQFNTSFSASSEIFGTFPIGLGPFEGLRHRLSPSLSANYRPNFNEPFWGRTRRVRFEDGTVVPKDSLDGPQRYDILNGSPIRSSTEQRSLSFALRNVFETKRVEVDSTGERETNKITLLNLDLTGLSYNFAADSFQVGNRINLNARTRIDPFNISARSTFSPYALEARRGSDGERFFREVDRLLVADNPLQPARLTDFRFSLSADFSSGDGIGGGRYGTTGSRTTRSQRGRQRRNPRRSGTQSLSEFQLPGWSLNFNFNYSFRRPRKEITNRNSTLGVDFSLNVTPLWRVRGNTGYDFIDDKVATTRVSINRDLGCWDMSFSWVPFGRFQQYSFNLQVSSGQLSQLLRLQLPNQGGEGRFGGFGQQLRNTATGAAGLQGRPGGRGFP